MKQTLLFFTRLIFIFLTISNVFSQPNEIIKAMKKNPNYYIRHQQLEKTENDLSKEFFLNKTHKINSKINILGITEIVDSIIATRIDGSITKNKYTYDSKGNVIEALSKVWDGTKWENVLHLTYTYDQNDYISTVIKVEWYGGNLVNRWHITYTNGNMTVSLKEKWDGTKWKNDERTTYTYAPNGNLITVLLEEWENSTWTNEFRSNYTFDLNGNLTTAFTEDFNGTNFHNKEKVDIVFDSNGNIISLLTEVWNDTNWKNNHLWTANYDSKGKIIEESKEDWDGTKWDNNKHTTYTYDSNGNLTTKLNKYWDWDSTKWYSELITYDYDSKGNMIVESKEYWNGTKSRRTYTYDQNGNMIVESKENWDGAKWENDTRQTYTYDPNGNLTMVLNEDWDGINWVLDQDTYFSYLVNSAKDNLPYWFKPSWITFDISLIEYYYSLVYPTRIKYYYSKLFYFFGSKIELFYTPITNINKDYFTPLNYSLSQNYPNPFNPNTTISYSIPKKDFVQLKVYDILGKEVAVLVNKEQTSGSYKIEFNASNLTSGIYFYRLQSNGFTETKKLILLR